MRNRSRSSEVYNYYTEDQMVQIIPDYKKLRKINSKLDLLQSLLSAFLNYEILRKSLFNLSPLARRALASQRKVFY